MAFRWINKVGLAAVVNERLLVVRKRGTEVFILPGGKPEGGEGDLQTLAREVDEELGCAIDQPCMLGTFVDVAAGLSGAVVVVRLYTARIVGEPCPQAEIEELAWVDLTGHFERPLAPSIVNRILPYLRRRWKASAKSSRKLESEASQDLFEIV